jgi:beta-glucanase (GH16 family)
VGRVGLVILLVVVGWFGAPGLPGPPLPPVPTQPAGSSGGLWLPAFDDEFDGPGLDASKWSNGFGWGDSAANFAAWCDPAANVVDRGVLVQRADRVARQDKAYSGACLHTKGAFAQLYGYWEARIQVPAGRGLHSAFWGKPASEAWPPELDVEEVGGARADTVIMTVHWRDPSGHRMSNRRWPGLTPGYHVFGAEWSPDATAFYVDGEERARLTDGAANMSAEGPFYALLDLQVGLAGAVQADATTAFPAYQLVDYVRIWKRPSGAASSAAISAATAALCSTRATLATTVRPSVAAAIRSST